MIKRSAFLFPILLIGFFFLAKIMLSGLYLRSGQLENIAMAEPSESQKNPIAQANLGDDLRQREIALKKKEQELAKKEKEYEALRKDVEARIAELNELQQKLAAYAKKLAEREKALKDAKMAHLVSLYSAMEPAKAAAIMDKLNLKTVVKILRNMKGKSAGKILAMMNPAKGAKISEALSRD